MSVGVWTSTWKNQTIKNKPLGLLTNANKPKVALSPSRTLRVLHLRHLKENGVNIPDIGENKELFAQFRKYSSYTSGK